MFSEVSPDMTKSNVLQTALKSIELWSEKWQLSLASNKCAVLHIGHKNQKQVYTLKNTVLNTVANYKDLGIYVTSDLSMSVHCAKIAAKAVRVIGMLFRTFSTKNFETLLNAYKTFVRPIVESSTVVWSPCYIKDINCIERVQKIFTRRLFKHCKIEYNCYEARCKYFGLCSLEFRRLINDLCYTYKIVHNKLDVNDCLLRYNNNSYMRGHNFRLKVEHMRVNCRKHFFCCRVVEPWNSLPKEIVSLQTVKLFRSNLSNEDLNLKMMNKVYRF